jgi:hypothetical protein
MQKTATSDIQRPFLYYAFFYLAQKRTPVQLDVFMDSHLGTNLYFGKPPHGMVTSATEL